MNLRMSWNGIVFDEGVDSIVTKDAIDLILSENHFVQKLHGNEQVKAQMVKMEFFLNVAREYW